jgi:hypothetical protein
MPDKVLFEGAIATSAKKGALAAKTIKKLPDGSLEETSYDFITYWRFRSFTWRSHEQAAEQLKALALQRESMMIMGRAIVDDPQRRQRRRWAKPAESDAGRQTQAMASGRFRR